MSQIKFTINTQLIESESGVTLLEAARCADIYIPTLCSHPDLPPAGGIEAVKIVFQGDRRIENSRPDKTGEGCALCLAEIEGQVELAKACETLALEGMVVVTENERIKAQRQENLVPIMTRHRHACLTCAQQEGCSRSQCSSNVPENERCCTLFGCCELQNVVNYIGVSDHTPKWISQNLPELTHEPLFNRDYNLCIGCTRCVRVCRDVRGVEAIGFVYDENGDVQIATLGPTLAESGCKFCTACVEVCPTGALTDKAVRAGKKEEDLVPCKAACPAYIDVPGYLRLIANGLSDAAHTLIREKVPFPGILGRVCFHPCEDVCRRGEVNEPVSVCALKRYAADNAKDGWRQNVKILSDTGKKIAIVGAGPAGLTAAFYLRQQGHAVTVFDAQSKAGGMMRYGIPAHRLPAAILDKEIQDIFDLGVDFRPKQKLGHDFTLNQLENDGYDAVFLGLGAWQSRRIPLEGCELPEVLWGIDFLRDVAQGKPLHLKEFVLVVGGGNVAIDVALTALRCGATDVSVASLENRNEMPASDWEIEGAVAEGVKLLPSWGPDKILSNNGHVTGVDMLECTCVFDENGMFCPEFGDTKECFLVDQIILAVGQSSDLSFLEDGSTILTDKGQIVVDQDTLETGRKSVYAGGDVVNMPGSVIHAIAAGRRAAAAIDKSLTYGGGSGDIDKVLFKRETPEPRIGRHESFADWPRERMPEIPFEKRADGFQEIALGYADKQALREAARCLQCDLRLNLGANASPPEKRIAFTAENIKNTPSAEGVYQLSDENHNVLAIKGTPDLQASLQEEWAEGGNAAWFELEEDKMYSMRESELIQKYLQEYGEMPGSGLDDDLF